MKTALIVAAAALTAMAAPVLAQAYDAGLTDPTTSAPMFYSGSTPYGMFTGTTTEFSNMRIYNTYGPGDRITTCVQSFSGSQSFVNCY